jgi:hypothetical protein
MQHIMEVSNMCIKVLVLFMSVRGIAPNLVVNSYGEVP